MPSARPEEYFEENQFFPEKFCFFFVWSLELQCFSCPLSNKLSKWVKTAFHVFRWKNCGKFTLKNCFFFNCLDFEQRKMDFLWKINRKFFKTVAYVSEREKFRRNDFGQLIVISFERWPGRTWNLLEKNRLGCRNYVLFVQRNFYRLLFLKDSVKNFRFIGWVLKFMGQWRNFFFRDAKIEENVKRNKFKKILYQKGKILLTF